MNESHSEAKLNMNKNTIKGFLFAGLLLGAPAAFAKEDGHGKDCKLQGSYSYLYNGTSFSSVPVPLSEAGSFSVDKSGVFAGEGSLTFYFSNFYGQGPLWLELHEVLTNGASTPDSSIPCAGSITYETTVTVVQSS